MSKLLLDEHPLMVMPQLAKKIGLNESMILQQIHYWNEINKRSNNNYRDGHYWTFNSIDRWQDQFPFWSKRTIQRTIANLEKTKLVVTGNYNKLQIDRTKWYRIDYKVLTTLEESPLGQNGTINVTEWLNHLDKLELPLPEINTESNSDNNNKRYTITSNGDYVFNYFSFKYKNHYNKEHPTITYDQLDRMKDTIEMFRGEYSVGDEEWKFAIDEHFKMLKRNKNNNGSILGFINGDDMQGSLVRYLEVK